MTPPVMSEEGTSAVTFERRTQGVPSRVAVNEARVPEYTFPLYIGADGVDECKAEIEAAKEYATHPAAAQHAAAHAVSVACMVVASLVPTTS